MAPLSASAAGAAAIRPSELLSHCFQNAADHSHMPSSTTNSPAESKPHPDKQDAPSDSDMGSVADDSDLAYSSEEEEEEEEEPTACVLVVVGCRTCLSYFMVDRAAASCPRCGDSRDLVRFGDQ